MPSPGVTVRIVALAGALIGALPLDGQSLELTATVADRVFSEGEPIYAIFRVTNLGADTAWITPFKVLTHAVGTSLARIGDDTQVPQRLVFEDIVTAPGWHGDPLPPGATRYATIDLQYLWGESGPLSTTLFCRNLRPGVYRFRAWFIATPVTDPGVPPVRLEAPPVVFTVRSRTGAEEARYREIVALSGMAWDKSKRPGFIARLRDVVTNRLAGDSLDSFAPLLITSGIDVARGIGLPIDRETAGAVTALQIRIARAQRSRPSGAVVGMALGSALGDSAVFDLMRDLDGSLAGAVLKDTAHHRRGGKP